MRISDGSSDVCSSDLAAQVIDDESTVGRTRPHNAHHGGDRFLHQGHRTDACHLSCLKGSVLLHLIECRRNRDDRALDLRAHLFWQVSEQGLEDFGRAPLWRQWILATDFDRRGSTHEALEQRRILAAIMWREVIGTRADISPAAAKGDGGWREA